MIYGNCDVNSSEELPYSSEELPLGISFFTFQQLAYVVDVYRRKEEDKKTPSVVDFASFVTFFPHLIAGPITRSDELLRPIRLHAYRLSSQSLEIGLFVFSVGLIRKIVFADSFAKIADAVFDAASNGSIDAVSALFGIVAFTLQIYFDFSGYSEMAVGLALIIGIQLPWNFDVPYRSCSTREFWRRWHITLSNLLRDYLYIPLGGSRTGEVRKYLNILITMALGGLWHGASWTFVAWGLVHGVYLVVAHWWRGHVSWRLPILPGVIVTIPEPQPEPFHRPENAQDRGAELVACRFCNLCVCDEALYVVHSGDTRTGTAPGALHPAPISDRPLCRQSGTKCCDIGDSSRCGNLTPDRSLRVAEQSDGTHRGAIRFRSVQGPEQYPSAVL